MDDEHLVEIADSQYTALALITKEIVVTEPIDGQAIDVLSRFGVVLQTINVKDKPTPVTEHTVIRKGPVIKVSGVASSVRKAADHLGYLNEAGRCTFLAVCAAAAPVPPR